MKGVKRRSFQLQGMYIKYESFNFVFVFCFDFDERSEILILQISS